MTETKGSYDYFEHKADMGIVGRGVTMEEAFSQAARAMFDLMVDVHEVKPIQHISLECYGNDTLELLVEWLNRLLAEADIHHMVFSRFEVENLSESYLKGSAWGELFDPKRHRPKTEVKAATYSMLSIQRVGNDYVARCVVDL